MADRTTGFADGRRMVAFRAAEAVLREDPVLSREVKTWSTWRGEGNDKMPTSSGMLPFLQLSPVLLPNEVMGTGESVAVMGVRIRIAARGLVAEDVVNFWDAVEDALVKGRPFRDTTVFCFLQSQGAFAHRVVSPGIDAWRSRDNPPAEFLEGAGMLVLRISRRS